MTLHVDYIDNFETKAIDAIRDLSEDAERIDIAVAFLSYRGWVDGYSRNRCTRASRHGRLLIYLRYQAPNSTRRW